MWGRVSYTTVSAQLRFKSKLRCKVHTLSPKPQASLSQPNLMCVCYFSFKLSLLKSFLISIKHTYIKYKHKYEKFLKEEFLCKEISRNQVLMQATTELYMDVWARECVLTWRSVSKGEKWRGRVAAATTILLYPETSKMSSRDQEMTLLIQYELGYIHIKVILVWSLLSLGVNMYVEK